MTIAIEGIIVIVLVSRTFQMVSIFYGCLHLWIIGSIRLLSEASIHTDYRIGAKKLRPRYNHFVTLEKTSIIKDFLKVTTQNKDFALHKS